MSERRGKDTDKTEHGDDFRIFDPSEHGQISPEDRKERERDVGTGRS